MASIQDKEEVFRQMLEAPENQSCLDCGSIPTAFASVSHGTFICFLCAQTVHKELGMDVSFTRSIDTDYWSPRQLKIMTVGGNGAFQNYMRHYESFEDLEKKYKSKAARYYRDMIKVIAAGQEWTRDRLSMEEGLLPHEVEVIEHPQPAPAPKPRSSISSFFGSVYSSTKEIGANLSDGATKLIRDPRLEELKGKTKSALSSVGDGLKSGTDAAIRKGKQLAENRKLQAVKTSALGYMEAVRDSASETFTKINQNSRVQATRQDLAHTFNTIGQKASQKINKWRGMETGVEPGEVDPPTPPPEPAM